MSEEGVLAFQHGVITATVPHRMLCYQVSKRPAPAPEPFSSGSITMTHLALMQRGMAE